MWFIVVCFVNRFKVFKYDGSLNYEKKYDKLYQVCYVLKYGHFIIVEVIFFLILLTPTHF